MTPKYNTLHEAIIDVLKRKGEASFEEIADEIATNNLWKRKSDGLFPEAFQIRLRSLLSKNYKDLFEEVCDGKISLKK